jgi:hypothetical protein
MALIADSAAGSSILDLSSCEETRPRDPERRSRFVGVE